MKKLLLPIGISVATIAPSLAVVYCFENETTILATPTPDIPESTESKDSIKSILQKNQIYLINMDNI